MSKFALKPLLKGLFLAALTGGVISYAYAQPQANGLQTGEAIFEVLASEIALQRGEAGLAYNTYLEMARQYKDPRLAQRAMEIAIAGGSPDLAMQAAKTWDDLSPASDSKPKEVLVTLLILSNRWTDAIKPAIALLRQQTPAQQENTLLQIKVVHHGNKSQWILNYVFLSFHPENSKPYLDNVGAILLLLKEVYLSAFYLYPNSVSMEFDQDLLHLTL